MLISFYISGTKKRFRVFIERFFIQLKYDEFLFSSKSQQSKENRAQWALGIPDRILNFHLFFIHAVIPPKFPQK